MNKDSYFSIVMRQFVKNRLGVIAALFLIFFALLGIYAPLFASSKPLLVEYGGTFYFPLFRYLFYTGFYTKPIDLFYNVLMFTLPIAIAGLLLFKQRKKAVLIVMGTIQVALFFLFWTGIVHNPAGALDQQRIASEKSLFYREDPLLAPIVSPPTWETELRYMAPYEKLNRLLRYKERKNQQERLLPYLRCCQEATGKAPPTLWEVDRRHATEEKRRLEVFIQDKKPAYEEAEAILPTQINAYRPYSHSLLLAKLTLEKERSGKDPVTLQKAEREYEEALKDSLITANPLRQTRLLIQTYQDSVARLAYLQSQEKWEETENQKVHQYITAFLRPFHWEDDAGGQQIVNKFIPWWELSRINRKDLVAGLLFGIRISLVVGFTAVFLSLVIALPLGMVSGYFAGKWDLLICRLIEIWEAMPTFFMLLLIVAITQSKSIFLVITVLGIFGWTGLARFMRGEVLKQRALPYVLACQAQGFRHPRILFSHIFPNAIPPILTLIPFAMMAAITSEAGLSFLGLGEEGSTSWGVLMAEGRSVFPAESYLLWPPAIMLTLLLVSIALVGDALRDAMDPKMATA